MAAIALGLLLLALNDVVMISAAEPAYVASDLVEGYLPGAQRFLDTGSPYLTEQLAGPWQLDKHSFIHPPAALPLFVPFLALPPPVWWILPLAFTAYVVWSFRPAPWTWPLMALCLVWPRSTGAILAGNTDMWVMAIVAAGARWHWPVVFLAIKPTFAFLAVLGVRHRSTWVAAAIALGLVVLTLPLWRDWWTAIGNAGLAPVYSVLNLPLVMLPVIAWAGRRSGPGRRPTEATVTSGGEAHPG